MVCSFAFACLAAEQHEKERKEKRNNKSQNTAHTPKRPFLSPYISFFPSFPFPPIDRTPHHLSPRQPHNIPDVGPPVLHRRQHARRQPRALGAAYQVGHGAVRPEVEALCVRARLIEGGGGSDGERDRISNGNRYVRVCVWLSIAHLPCHQRLCTVPPLQVPLDGRKELYGFEMGMYMQG